MAGQRVEICLKKKKPTSITNITLLSFRKSEQQVKTFAIFCFDEIVFDFELWILPLKVAGT